KEDLNMLTNNHYKVLKKYATLVLASHNPGKIREMRELLTDYEKDFTLVDAGTLKLIEPLENGKTFIENALIKARAAMHATGLPSLADDSGLCIDALDGKPGVNTAEWFVNAKGERDFPYGFEKIKRALKPNDLLGASVVCVFALVIPGCSDVVIERHIRGTLIFDPDHYVEMMPIDSIFKPDGYEKTFACDLQLKNKISARAQASFALKETFDKANR
ncbi:hypothetical protein EBQ91_07105, partial [bacterium]|nr:hypothetical protein [bacterium]